MEFLHANWLRLWFFWIVATVLGNLKMADTILGLITSKIYVDYTSPLFFLLIAFYFLFDGVSSGIAQWLVLRIYINMPGWLWVFTIILEHIVRIYLLDIDIASTFATFIIYSGVIGLIIGVLQWLILRPRINHAEWWVLILIAGYIISAVAVIAVSLVKPALLITGILSTIVYGALTGAGLVALLVQSSKEKSQQA